MKALILAGGFAKRLGPLGQHIPKAMFVTEGDTILGHLVKKLEALKIEPIISTNQKFKDFFSKYKKVIVEKATAEEQKLGAVSAINYAIKQMKIDDDLIVICADNYLSSDLKGFVSSYTGEPVVGIYYVGKRPDMKPEEMASVKFDGSEKYPPPKQSFAIKDFKEKVKPPLSEYVGVGIYILPKRTFPMLDEFCKDKKQDAPGFFVQHLMERGEKIKGYLFTGEWFDLSHKSYLREFKDSTLVESNDACVVCEKPLGEKLVLSITALHPGKQTAGQSRDVAGVYFFVEGEGEIEIDGKQHRVGGKDIVPIMPKESHRVHNTSNKELIFICASEK